MESFQKKLSSIEDSAFYEARKYQRFILLIGYQGAGKTTAIERLAAWLKEQNLTPGIVSNDQADGLIDTAIGRQHSREAVEQVTGGWFCCRASELGEALGRLGMKATSSKVLHDHLPKKSIRSKRKRAALDPDFRADLPASISHTSRA